MLPENATLQQTRSFLERELRKIHSEGEAAAISLRILEHAGYPTARLLQESSSCPGSEFLTQIKEIVTEIHTGRPIQYVLGYTYFMDLKIEVDENVLIPRPETEEMVVRILRDPSSPPSRILDLGTGSGCIALALKQYFPDATVFGLDLYPGAIKMAKRNAGLNQLDVTWIEGDMNRPLEGIPGRVDLLVSNPPYVRESERSLMKANVLEHEPEKALFVPDDDPLQYYRSIAKIGLSLLSTGGRIWVEINEHLGDETAGLFSDHGYQQINIIRDIHEKERFISAGGPVG
ncbi:MAG: peptide chain release factor N(5)-glutamine methyltransferase [Bacteroidales bacterium]